MKQTYVSTWFIILIEANAFCAARICSSLVSLHISAQRAVVFQVSARGLARGCRLLVVATINFLAGPQVAPDIKVRVRWRGSYSTAPAPCAYFSRLRDNHADDVWLFAFWKWSGWRRGSRAGGLPRLSAVRAVGRRRRNRWVQTRCAAREQTAAGRRAVTPIHKRRSASEASTLMRPMQVVALKHWRSLAVKIPHGCHFRCRGGKMKADVP